MRTLVTTSRMPFAVDETLKIGGVGDLLLLASIVTMVWSTIVLGRLAAPQLTDPSPPDLAAPS